MQNEQKNSLLLRSGKAPVQAARAAFGAVAYPADAAVADAEGLFRSTHRRVFYTGLYADDGNRRPEHVIPGAGNVFLYPFALRRRYSGEAYFSLQVLLIFPIYSGSA